MTSSHKTSMLSDLLPEGGVIPPETLHYFRARFKNRLFDLVLRRFREKAASDGLTKAELARRLNKRPEVVTRLLGAPGNWELETVSDLLLGIAAEELSAEAVSLNRKPTNYQFNPWIEETLPSYVELSGTKPRANDASERGGIRLARSHE